MILPTGKGVWLHKYIEPPDLIVSRVREAGLGHVFIKIADGSYPYGANYPRQTLIQKLREAGLQVFGWQYTYGRNPVKEAEIAAAMVIDLNLDGLVVDAEREYKNRHKDALVYASTVRQKLPARPIGLSTYRYPQEHRTFPFKEFRNQFDFDSPQVYWLLASNPVQQLLASKQQYDALTPRLPYIPSGSAWKQGNWAATPSQVKSFIEAVHELQCSGCTMWEYNRAIEAKLWGAISEAKWAPPQPPKPTIEERLDDHERRIRKLEGRDDEG